ncbi:unnamed protein product [Linum trigynum]|uniref:Uncharacterized protein n=1 Tax=Linum trigynum TaxID=586398 RepID=A0AAV2FAN3_9ROSI
MEQSTWWKSRVQILLPPPFQEEKPYPWRYEEASSFQEDFLPPPEPRSELELLVERFTRGLDGASSSMEQSCYTPQSSMSQSELMVEWFIRDTEASSEVKSLATTPSDSSFLWSTEQFLRKTERIGEIVKQACAQLLQKKKYHLKKKERRSKARRKVVEEEVSFKEEEDLERSQLVERIEEKRREVAEANGAHDEGKIVVDEASTSYKCYQSFPLDLDVLLEKDPFASLCRAKAKPSGIPLDGCDEIQLSVHYMGWGKEKRDEGKEARTRGWSLMTIQVHEPSIMDSSNASDLRHHLTNKNLNLKEVQSWTGYLKTIIR